ncbi:E3 ubiquitin-protein ligase TRIM16-like isoform X7 [Erpetoichthys calabaricus]|uniref:E3 ubiquitin-protein ligase TRIM16-like isoform X7 n=1 Tax=Erpetoichthys calabaricus TaxID=27687 RepID=UPI0022341BB6|nr:E3 ubiquitin-protein ligase TRIM16-like isoform X7 [Erpetoichthys calabaricus]
MAEAQLFVSQDEFTCSICLDTLSDPVSLHCGHSFCLKCLTDCWDQKEECSCPQCRETFTTRPALQRNTLLNEVIKKLKKTEISPPSPSENYAGPGDVECDFCIGKKFRAVNSCLMCMASFCQTHLQPHYEGLAWKHHKLIDPDGNLKEKLCAKHQKSLEIFCKTDDSCICMMCVVTGHKSHEMVELEMEREVKEKQLGATLSDIRRKLEDREEKLKETRRAMEQMKISVEKEVEEHEKSFNDLIHCIEENHRRLIERIREQEKKEKEKAEGVMERLEEEIEELKRKDSELKELSETKDNIHFLQTFSSRCVLPADGDLLSFTVTANFSSEHLRKELSCLKKNLEKICRWDIMTWTPSGTEAPIFTLQPPEPRSREEFLRYFCPLTLDINTAHKDLHLSEGNKKVTCERTQPEYPDHPDRFDYWEQVLCREALTGTRSYWEVECTGDWVLIGVAYKGLSRKGKDLECSFGSNNKSWSLLCADSQYAVRHNDEETEISAPYSPRIGVYLDWPAGSLSFYSVSHTMTLLHRFNTSFTEPLYPGFGFWLDCKSSAKICHLTPCDH